MHPEMSDEEWEEKRRGLDAAVETAGDARRNHIVRLETLQRDAARAIERLCIPASAEQVESSRLAVDAFLTALSSWHVVSGRYERLFQEAMRNLEEFLSTRSATCEFNSRLL